MPGLPIPRRGAPLRPRNDRPTVYQCVRLACEEKPLWSLRGEGGRFLKACDLHLANALRMLGLPARVDPFEDEPTTRLKPE